MQDLIYHQNKKNENNKFSILIPSWNNLNYLQKCIDSIKKNSSFEHQLIILVNEGNDGTWDWVKNKQGLDYILSKKNLGICFGLNACVSLVKTDYVLYLNDDMYVLPKWDLYLDEEIKKIAHHNFMFSSTMIEPYESNNKSVIFANYGTSLQDFEEEKLLSEFEQYEKKDWSGSSWPPLLMPKKLWDLVGGMSTEFSPGMYSDPDLSAKLWRAGIRLYKGVANSRVYHFGKKSTGKISQSDAKQKFIKKWGMSASFFYKKFLRMGEDFFGDLKEPKISFFEKLKNKTKQIIS